MTKIYSAEQIDQQGEFIGAEMQALEQRVTNKIPSKLFQGTFLTAADLPAGIMMLEAEGVYAYVDAGAGSDVELYIFDTDSSEWVKSGSGAGGSMSKESVKAQYESNADTNAFTNDEKQKLADMPAITIAADIDSFVAAFDVGLNNTGGGLE